VQVGDVLAIRLYQTPELNEEVTVPPDGRITTALAQSVPALGRTPAEIAANLRAAYASELKNPMLTVGIKSYAPSRIYVAGEVAAPGEFLGDGPALTLTQALAKAGGLKATGDPAHIFVLRRGPQDHPQVFAVDYGSVISGANPPADIRLAPFDVVYVPKTGIAQLYLWVNQHIQQFVPVSWGFSYSVTPNVIK
jgi:polysaccharide export outer membrane protein